MSSISANDLTFLPRDGTLVARVKSVLSDVAASKKLKEGECLILRECIEDCSPYPMYLMEKLSMVNSAVARLMMEEWEAFEKTVVKHLLDRSHSHVMMEGIVNEGLAAKKLKNAEARTIRDYFDDCGEHKYPDYVLSRLSDSSKGFLSKEKTLCVEALDLLTRYVAGK